MGSMDESTAAWIADGFAGQRMLGVPRPVVDDALRMPVTRRLLVTDAGFFPRATLHGRSRLRGASEHVIMVCTAGAGWCRTDEGQFDVGAADAVLLPKGRAHTYGAAEQDPWTLWWMHVVGTDSDELIAAASASATSPVVHLADPAPATSLISRVIDMLADGSTSASLVGAAGAAWHAMTVIAATGRQRATGEADPVDRALEHLRSTSPRRTNVAALAAMVGLSASHLNAVFRQRIGTGPLEFQLQLRMSRARELLDTTALTVAAVARATGYTDPLYFSRQFTKVHGQSPKAYRQRHHD
ncbi:AraC family transcriptional regulator [Mycobacterium sp. 21AC1]|uniref:AraC family transcriptional regulator n=1 Tax=[Mycobacterium] appelbergii TaxID=2939269 RepID=UPI002939507A|nr:AraC family transcriptional regulator [Mycobacterium sp. 21AC1]MDV3128054.1 AraC family transcriptional regulator [Mycobacterium sp. 21AC1]